MRLARTTESLPTQALCDAPTGRPRRGVCDHYLAPDGDGARTVHLGTDPRPAAEGVGHARDADGRLQVSTRRPVARHPQAGVADGKRRLSRGVKIYTVDDDVPTVPARREDGSDRSLGVGNGARGHQRHRVAVAHPREVPGPAAVAVARYPAVDDAHAVSRFRRVARRRRDVQAEDTAHQQTDFGSTPIPRSASA